MGEGASRLLVRAEPVPESTLSNERQEKILNYIRERFGVPENVKLILSAWHASAAVPGYDESMVSVGDGKNLRSQPVLVSRDQRYLVVVMGKIVDVPEDSPTVMVQQLRAAFKTPATLKMSLGPFRRSVSPELEEGTLTLEEGRTEQHRMVLLTRDHKHLILSELYSLDVDPREHALHNISLHGEPSQGPPDAPVTLVEYADLQCPTCARMQEFLETKVLPRYGNKVRVVFKEFPLVGIHDWSYTAAIADQCAYEINPSSYVPLRSAIFRNQQLINVANLRETLLNLGEQAGVDRVKLAGCLDAKSSSPRIQRDLEEAKRVDVTQTPTVFINGRLMVGLPSEDAYYQAIDEALREHK